LSSSLERGSPNLRDMMSLKKNGTKKIARKVAASIPPMTPVPTECRAPAPAPLEITSGRTPRMKASEVMRMGRKRSRAASTDAADTESPSWVFNSAYSTIRIAFFAASPSSVTRPIWKYTSLASGARPSSEVKTRLLIQMAASAPNVPKGNASITDSGKDHFSYCAARIRNAMNAPATSAMSDVPPDFFSWYEAPLQSKLKSDGSASFATFSIFSSTCPELTPGAPAPRMVTAGRLLKRSSVSGPLVYWMLASARTGTISPRSLRT
jgi:hypothetical protein